MRKKNGPQLSRTPETPEKCQKRITAAWHLALETKNPEIMNMARRRITGGLMVTITGGNTLNFDDMPVLNGVLSEQYVNKINGLKKKLKAMRNQAQGSQQTVPANTQQQPQKAAAAK